MVGRVPRRAFVLGATGALLGACREQAPPAATASKSPPTASTQPAEPPNWSRLAETFDGRVMLPPDADYTDAKAVFNERYADAAPAAVVVPASQAGVRAAVEFAAANDVPIAPRSGGHSYTGASAATGAMVIDLRALAEGVAYDEGTRIATVPAAANLDAVQTALAARGRLIPSGSCPTVGIAGLTLGGGLGTDARSAGLTCDALSSVSVVLPSGETVTASDDEHSDLFWALRGGGGGNIGVVTSFSFRTSAATDRDVVTMRFSAPALADVVWHWSAWLASADRSTWGMVNIPVGAGATGCTVIVATPAGTGPDRAGALAAAIGSPALSVSTRTLGRLDFINYFEGGADARRPRAFVAGSDVIEVLDEGAAQSIVAAAASWEGDGGATVIVESLSGAVRDVAPDATAFPWRRHDASIQWYAEPTTRQAVDTARRWLATAHRTVQASSVGGYVNYLESDTPAERYFGANLARLAAVRRNYDPDQVMGSGLLG